MIRDTGREPERAWQESSRNENRRPQQDKKRRMESITRQKTIASLLTTAHQLYQVLSRYSATLSMPSMASSTRHKRHKQRHNETIDTPTTRMDASKLLDSGSQHYQAGNYKDARAHFQQALDLQRAKSTTSAADLASTLQDLGNASYQLGCLDDARFQLEEVVTLKRQHYDTETKNLDIANALEDLARVCMAAGDYNSAKPNYNEALDMKRLVYGRSCAALVNTGTGALGMKQQVYGYDLAINSDIAFTVNKLGELAHKLGRYHNARKKFVEALVMYRASYGGQDAKHINIAICACQPWTREH
jgi:tetratricopeptide (TPR) repeat protein